MTKDGSVSDQERVWRHLRGEIASFRVVLTPTLGRNGAKTHGWPVEETKLASAGAMPGH